MLSDLKFIIGAVARKDIQEQLCHLCIENGTATAFDGMLSMSTPIGVKLNVRPHARTFMAAIKACTTESPITLHMTPTGRLSVRSGKFRAYVPAMSSETAFEFPVPEGDEIALTPALLASLEALAPLMGVDASRPWAMGLLVSRNSTYATNNVILAERWHGAGFPFDIVLPADCVNELLRIGVPPIKAKVTHNSASFLYEGGRWLRTQLVSNDWPERFKDLFDMPGDPVAIPAEFFDALTTLKGFSDKANRVFVFKDRVATSAADNDGATIEMATDGDGAAFNLEMLMKLKGIAKSITFAPYPKPCPWRGEMMRGVVVGQTY